MQLGCIVLWVCCINVVSRHNRKTLNCNYSICLLPFPLSGTFTHYIIYVSYNNYVINKTSSFPGGKTYFNFDVVCLLFDSLYYVEVCLVSLQQWLSDTPTRLLLLLLLLMDTLWGAFELVCGMSWFLCISTHNGTMDPPYNYT